MNALLLSAKCSDVPEIENETCRDLVTCRRIYIYIYIYIYNIYIYIFIYSVKFGHVHRRWSYLK